MHILETNQKLTAILYLLAAADEQSIDTIYYFLVSYLKLKYPETDQSFLFDDINS